MQQKHHRMIVLINGVQEIKRAQHKGSLDDAHTATAKHMQWIMFNFEKSKVSLDKWLLLIHHWAVTVKVENFTEFKFLPFSLFQNFYTQKSKHNIVHTIFIK